MLVRDEIHKLPEIAFVVFASFKICHKATRGLTLLSAEQTKTVKMLKIQALT